MQRWLTQKFFDEKVYFVLVCTYFCTPNIKPPKMADGNFNKTHLPYRPFQSGVNAGRAQMHTLAISAFKKWMTEQNFSDEDMTLHEMRFRTLLPL